MEYRIEEGELLREIAIILKEELVAEISADGVYIGFENGQKFLLSVTELE